MIHSATECMKFKKLRSRLGLTKWGAVGVLELLWHFTMRNAKLGDIGKYTDEEIAISIGWEDDIDKLIDTLVDLGWLDRNDEYRLVVHDWEEHCPYWIRGWVASRHYRFVVSGGDGRSKKRKGGKGKGDAVDKPDVVIDYREDDFDKFWAKYPNKVGKEQARKTWRRLVKEDEMPDIHTLTEAVTRHAIEWGLARTQKKYIPHPGTWLNGKRWLDEQEVDSEEPKQEFITIADIEARKKPDTY